MEPHHLGHDNLLTQRHVETRACAEAGRVSGRSPQADLGADFGVRTDAQTLCLCLCLYRQCFLPLPPLLLRQLELRLRLWLPRPKRPEDIVQAWSLSRIIRPAALDHFQQRRRAASLRKGEVWAPLGERIFLR